MNDTGLFFAVDTTPELVGGCAMHNKRLSCQCLRTNTQAVGYGYRGNANSGTVLVLAEGLVDSYPLRRAVSSCPSP
jgi:hypothetical protein